MSSSVTPISALQLPTEENFDLSLMIGSESLNGDPFGGSDCGIKDTTYYDDNQEINMVSCDESASSPAATNDESHNLISNLRPVQVPTSSNDEDSSDHSTATDEEKPAEQQVLMVSREGKRKQRAAHTPANMIQHQVRRRKKTASQVDYLKTLFHKLGGKWNG